MKLFTQKDQNLLTDVTRTAVKILLIITMFMIVTILPGIILSFILSIVIGDNFSNYNNFILSLWIISALIGFFILLINFDHYDD